MVEVSLTVGKLDASLALLLTKEHHLIEFPTILLPKNVQAGSIVKISCERDEPMETKDNESFISIQDQIMHTFGTVSPKAPALRVRNVTETSAVLEWDPIQVATAEVISLTLYKNGTRFGIIPSPLTRTAIKLSGLAIDTTYTFYLILATTAGTYRSEELTVKTHKMTDLTGITLCIGTIENTDIDRADLEETIKNIGAKPLQDTVKLDTTHFVCTVGEGPQWKRALNLNIPVVRPEWIKACEAERRLVSVRAYYLNADPKLRPPVQRSRAATQTTESSGESIGHRRAVSEIADSPMRTPVPSNQSATPEVVPEVPEPEEEIVPRPDITRESKKEEEEKEAEKSTEEAEDIADSKEETKEDADAIKETHSPIPTLSVSEHVDAEPEEEAKVEESEKASEDTSASKVDEVSEPADEEDQEDEETKDEEKTKEDAEDQEEEETKEESAADSSKTEDESEEAGDITDEPTEKPDTEKEETTTEIEKDHASSESKKVEETHEKKEKAHDEKEPAENKGGDMEEVEL